MPKSSSRYNVDISKLSLNLDGCRFGDPPPPQQQQQQRQDDNHRPNNNNQQCSSSSSINSNNNNGGSDGETHELSPLSTHHWNHVAQYPPQNHNKHHHDSTTELTSPLGTTYRKEGLSIGHNFLRFQGSTLSTNFNTGQLDIVECVGRGVCSSVWKARRCHHRATTTNNNEQQQQIELGGGELEEEEEEYYALKVFSMRDPQKRIMLIRELKLLCSTLSSSSLSDDAAGSVGKASLKSETPSLSSSSSKTNPESTIC